MTQVLDLLRDAAAILTDDHFVFTSGKHSSAYVNKDALYPHTTMVSEVGQLFAEKLKDIDMDTVVGPALGAILLSQATAYHLTQQKGKEVFGVYTEKTPDKNQIFTRGYDRFVRGKNVVVVEDITSTGGSALKTVNAIRSVGGTVVGVCVMVNRNPQQVNTEFFGAPFFALAEFVTEIYDAASCPLCASGVPINTTVGHGKKFLESKK